jgi:hypothetical protein
MRFIVSSFAFRPLKMGHIGRSLMTLPRAQKPWTTTYWSTRSSKQAIVARHIAGERISAEETINELAQLLDSVESVKELAKRGYSSEAFR